MTVVTGKITKVVKLKGQATTSHGNFDRLAVTVQNNEGNDVTIDKLGKPGHDPQRLVGQNVQVTYQVKHFQKDDGTEFSRNTAQGKDWVLLDQNNKPQQKGGTGGGGTYDSNGARNGMLVNNAVTLAIARQDMTTKGLMQAADDVMQLTIHVEKGGKTTEMKTEPKSIKQTKTKQQPEEEIPETNQDDDCPF